MFGLRRFRFRSLERDGDAMERRLARIQKAVRSGIAEAEGSPFRAPLMDSRVERLPIAHGGANSNASLGIEARRTPCRHRSELGKNAMRPPRDYRWNPIETAPLD